MDIFLSQRLRSASMVFGTAMKSESKSCLQEHVWRTTHMSAHIGTFNQILDKKQLILSNLHAHMHWLEHKVLPPQDGVLPLHKR